MATSLMKTWTNKRSRRNKSWNSWWDLKSLQSQTQTSLYKQSAKHEYSYHIYARSMKINKGAFSTYKTMPYSSRSINIHVWNKISIYVECNQERNNIYRYWLTFMTEPRAFIPDPCGLWCCFHLGCRVNQNLKHHPT